VALRFDESAYLRLIRGETRGLAAAAARCGLSAAALGYRIAAAVRNAAFDHGLRLVTKVSVPVVSIGNISLGGTGKTPMVEWVARWYREREIRVAILSRGYGESAGLNDEGRVLEDNLPDVPHLQNRDRVRLAHTAVEELESELLVLDDGFQHRRLARDLDIILLDALQPPSVNRIFPRGLLREPMPALRRAHVVVLSRADLVDSAVRADIRTKVKRVAPTAHWVEARHAPRDLVDAEGVGTPLNEAVNTRVAAFCGIGNPDGFRRTLEVLGVELIDFRVFPDHHAYSRTDISDLISWLGNVHADLALTTQKDLVKVRTQTLGAVPLRALRIGLEIVRGQGELERSLEALLSQRGQIAS
jgi:tetraacyldisaccharide 4'-kinase